ncbi:MAG: dihydrodipicolinate synthase family protein [Acidobacteria bacterium]|nr:dihydrodipicolinate synthase family protein [Acidobacteriota bacterium]MBI3428024.1 dihydrodipicolinate synthase family protein [Acidobacteriota bacterium]
MMMDSALRTRLLDGAVIPAHPLALTAERKLDERRQRALTRYYCAAGAGGLAVGVHTTQFAIRDPRVALFEPVLQLALETMREHEQRRGQALIKVAGVCGPTPQACAEAGFARGLGYDLGLLSLAALPLATTAELIAHCRAVAEIIPLFGFYLQPAVGGRLLDYHFWRAILEIENVVAIKVAPFNRYQTLDVVRALAESGRHTEVALYTGNDDNIVADLLTEFRVAGQRLHFAGGLLGHWAVWTRRAVELLAEIKAARINGQVFELLARAAEITDANAVLFDAAHNFAGCIAGLHEVLRRQGLLVGRWCLDPREDLSPGQMEEIDRLYAQYPQLNDDAFVAEHLESWLA